MVDRWVVEMVVSTVAKMAASKAGLWVVLSVVP